MLALSSNILSYLFFLGLSELFFFGPHGQNGRCMEFSILSWILQLNLKSKGDNLLRYLFLG